MRHILSVLLLLVALATQGQRAYHIKHFGETDELRVRGEVSIAQVNGFIFVGTTEGLRAFDGKHASLYRVPDHDRLGGFYGMITGVVQSADGVIWTGTPRGFYTFDIEHERLVPFKVEGLPEDAAVSHMKFDAYDRLWVVVNGKVYRIDTAKRRAFCIDENLSHVRYLMLTKEGTVWMGDVEGLLYRYDEPNNRVRAYTVKPEGTKEFRKIAAITEMQDGSLAVTSETDGVCLFSVKDFTSRLVINQDEGKPLLAHTAITPDGVNLWVGTEHGILICNVKTGACSALRQSDTAFHTLTDNAVYTLFLDNEQGIWAGTYFGGLHRISLLPSNFTISLPEVEGVDVVSEMVQDKQGRIWVGAEDGGLYEFDEETLRLSPAKISWGGEMEPYNIQSLLLVDDELWLSTATSGIYMVDLNTLRLKEHVTRTNPTSQGVPINPISMCRQNGDIFASTSSGVYKYYPTTKDFRLIPELMGMYVHHLMADRQGNVWMCTYNNGLWEMSKKNGKWVPRKTPFEYQCVTSFFQDSHGVYWVGNDQHGLMAYDAEMGVTLPIDLKPLEDQEALNPTAVPKDKDLCVTNIIEDSYHRLWINTFDGIYTYNPEYGLVAHFTMDNGLPSPYFNLSSGLLTQKGLVLLGSYKGLVSVDPGLFRALRDKLRPFLLNLYVNGEHIMPNDGSGILQRTLFLQKEIHLRADQSTFTIFVAAPTFQNEAVVWFRYRMNPNERWTLTSDMAAIQMHNLASGTYHVEVQASYDRDKWEGETTTLTIVVEQPVYLSFWAIVGYVCLIILGVILGMWIVRCAHLRRRSRHAKEMEARKKQLEE